MKKFTALVLAALLLCSLAGCKDSITHDRSSTGTITYTYGTISFTEELTATEISQVLDILDGKLEVPLKPGCGFTRLISLTIGGHTYALAPDGCGALVNCTTDRCITLSETEQKILEALFTSRGAIMPCGF